MVYVLDASKMTDKATSHAYLKEVLELPEYYGHNLDALHDCLEEMTDWEVEVIHTDDMLAALGRYGELLLQVLSDVKKR